MTLLFHFDVLAICLFSYLLIETSLLFVALSFLPSFVLFEYNPKVMCLGCPFCGPVLCGSSPTLPLPQLSLSPCFSYGFLLA